MWVTWVWPAVLILMLGIWKAHGQALWFLAKGTWVLFAGVMQGWILFCAKAVPKEKEDGFLAVMVLLSVASFFLLPFGLAKWGFFVKRAGSGLIDAFRMNPYWEYAENLMASLLLHIFVPLVPLALILGDAPGAGIPPVGGRGEVPSGGEISDGFYGHRGEFDLNDEARRVSEDMQQFHSNHPDADLSDHYFWEDVVDADTDGYLED